MSLSRESPSVSPGALTVSDGESVIAIAEIRRRRAIRRSVPLIAFVAAIVGAASLGRIAGAPDLLLPAGIGGMVVLAYANGTNDVSKAIATLVGSGVTNYRRAIAWGTAWTVVGALCSALVASVLIRTFTSGFIASGAHETQLFALAVVVGAVLWVFVSTRTAMPVSTTHAITGALVSVGVVAVGSGNIRWSGLTRSVPLPLASSPFIALALALLAFAILSLIVQRGARPGEIHGDGEQTSRAMKVMNGLHWLSSGAASFARGLNDTPKLVALGVAFFLIAPHSSTHNATYQTPYWLFVLVALGIGAGSIIGGLHVTQTLAEKVTKMDHVEGFAANLTTAALVAVAANLGLTVFTTQVSAGAIIGIGLRNGVMSVNWRIVRDMALAWLLTLPLAGLLGVLVYLTLLFVHGG